MAIPVRIIQRSVGLGGANQRADVQLLQKVLNAVPTAKGGPLPLLDVDGLCGPLTCGAISKFQYRNFGTADGRVDPGQRTEQELAALLSALGVLAAMLSGGFGVPGAATPRPPMTGANSPIRQRFMAVCKQLLPPLGAYTAGSDPTSSTGSACGEFPGRVFRYVPVLLPHQPGAFKIQVDGLGMMYLTTPTPGWEKIALAVDKKYPPARTWVPFAGNRPLPGDIYILGNYERPAEFQHVGVIVSADGDKWVTADAGQGNGWQSGFVERNFSPDGKIDGEKAKTGKLRGWVDLDALFAVAIAAFPKNL